MYLGMGKRTKKKSSIAEKAPTGYTFGQLLLVNGTAWGLFFITVLIVDKTYKDQGGFVLSFLAWLGVGFSIGTIIDVILDRLKSNTG